MARIKRSFRCTNCGFTSPTWQGICPECKEGGTLQETSGPAERAQVAVPRGSVPAAAFRDLSQISADDHERIGTGLAELDRVLGGGLVPGSYIVVAGEPGVGKTTVSTELLIHLAGQGRKVGYVSGEESEAQARMRFERLGAKLGEQNLPISTETSVERICEAIAGEGFDLLVVDSVQTIFSEGVAGGPGSVSQVRECGHKLMQAAKDYSTSVLLVGQVTKGGDMAGPRTLEHMVDVVLAFEGDRREQYRILRAVKNRFGSTDEIGVFEMTATGLNGIADPSSLFVSDREVALPGSSTCAVIEGTRPVMCEIQALVTPSNLPQPVRASRGLDPKRAQMLLAVMARHAGYPLGSYDVYLNVAGGLKIDEPGADLAVCLAVASAYSQRVVKDRICAFGEVTLLGEVRPAPQADRRRKEAERLTYRTIDDRGSIKSLCEGSLGEKVEQELEEAPA